MVAPEPLLPIRKGTRQPRAANLRQPCRIQEPGLGGEKDLLDDGLTARIVEKLEEVSRLYTDLLLGIHHPAEKQGEKSFFVFGGDRGRQRESESGRKDSRQTGGSVCVLAEVLEIGNGLLLRQQQGRGLPQVSVDGAGRRLRPLNDPSRERACTVEQRHQCRVTHLRIRIGNEAGEEIRGGVLELVQGA